MEASPDLLPSFPLQSPHLSTHSDTIQFAYSKSRGYLHSWHCQRFGSHHPIPVVERVSTCADKSVPLIYLDVSIELCVSDAGG